jgi:hypothetical protein
VVAVKQMPRREEGLGDLPDWQNRREMMQKRAMIRHQLDRLVIDQADIDLAEVIPVAGVAAAPVNPIATLSRAKSPNPMSLSKE